MNRPQSQLAAGDPSPSTGGRIEDVVSAGKSQSAAISPIGASRKSSRWQVLVAVAATALAAILVYHNSFSGPLIFDDQTWIAGNRTIRHLWPLGAVLFPAKPAVVGGRPVLNLTLAINYALGGTEVEGYRVVNLAIHILAAWALLGVIRQTLLSPALRGRFGSAATPLAAAIAILWAVHPLQTSAVTYLTQRNESLMALFYLLALYGVIRGAAASDARWSRVVWYATAFVACLLGMFTKETMVTAPFVVLLYDRTFMAGTFRAAIRQRGILYAGLFASWIALAWCLISSDFHSGTAGIGVKHFTPWSYLLTQPGVIAHYLGQAFWPSGLSLDYGWPPATTAAAIVPPGLLIVSLLALTCWALVKRPALGFVGTAFFLILAPTSSFVPIDDAAFDHRMYLPLACVIALVVIAVWMVSRRWLTMGSPQLSQNQIVSTVVSLIVVGVPAVALGWATIDRNELFKSELAIWQDACAKQPNNARALDHVGSALKQLGRKDEAIEYYRRAMAADPKYILPINNLAGHYDDAGDISKAEALFRQGLEIEPDNAWMNINLAGTLARQGKFDEAMERCRADIERKPEFPEARVVLADVVLRQGRPADAERLYREALQLNPDLPEGHAKLAVLLLTLGRPNEAIEQLRALADLFPKDVGVRDKLAVALAMQHRDEEAATEFRAALAANPKAAAVHFHFGLLLARQGRWADAMAQWREAARLQPGETAVIKRLAWTLATCPDASIRNGAEALRLAEQVARLSHGDDPETFDTLAAAQAESGQFDLAARAAEQAMHFATAQNNHELASRIADRLSLYLTRTPYREPAITKP